MFRQGRLPAALVVTGVLLAAACNDHPTATSPLAPSDGPSAVAATASSVKFRSALLPTNKLRIDAQGVNASLGITNSGTQTQTGLSIRAEIVQGSASRQAANLPVLCEPGGVTGVIPVGNCDMNVAVAASNSAPGAGTLGKGGAVLVLHLLQTVGGSETELDSKKVDVNLVVAPVISALTLSSSTLPIDGPSVTWTATLENPSNAIQNAGLDGTIVQGATRRSAGGLTITCKSSFGVLQPGTCTVSWTAIANNGSGGTGTLVPGPATLELQLFYRTSSGFVTLDTRTVAVTLVSSTPSIASLVMSTTSFKVGVSVGYTVQLQNYGFPQSGVLLRGEMIQGTVTKAAGGTFLNCAATLGDLPTGTCTMNFNTLAQAGNTGGTFEAGPARFVLHLYKVVNGSPSDFDTETVDVTILPPDPTILSVTPASTDVVFDDPVRISYSADIENLGPTRTGMSLQAWVRQGSASLAAGGGPVVCNGGPFGELPTGTCTASRTFGVGSESTGLGVVVTGPATLDIELKYNDGTTNTVLHTFSVPINYTGP